MYIDFFYRPLKVIKLIVMEFTINTRIFNGLDIKWKPKEVKKIKSITWDSFYKLLKIYEDLR